MPEIFPALDNWEATKETLHWYCKAVGVIPRAHLEQHPKWWHISLTVLPDGLLTKDIPLPDGGAFFLKMDLKKHAVTLATSKGESRDFSMTAGTTATAFGEALIAAVAELGLKGGQYAREKFENDAPRSYDPEAAGKYLQAVSLANEVFMQHRGTLEGEKGPVQLWPHGFDLAFEWFGTRRVESNGKEYPAQLNLGFSPGESSHKQPYFYSNPWPFEEDKLVGRPLPDGARWFTKSWKGTLLPYEELAGDPLGEARLLEYARRVYELASPTLMA
jgi:hypothetical protein